MQYRPITNNDIPALFDVRIAARENAYTREELTALDITEITVAEKMAATYRGWLCEADGNVVGFAMGDSATGEMWVIAVLSDYEGQGIGARLITLVEEWLWSEGWQEIWLTTDTDTRLRAYGFYRRQGWYDSEIKDNLRYLKKKRPVSLSD